MMLPVRQHQRFLTWLFVWLGASAAAVVTIVQAMPLRVTVRKGEQECLYDNLEADERVTISSFVLSGATLKAQMTLEGPLAPTNVASALELLHASERFQKITDFDAGHALKYSQAVDYEHLYPPSEDEEEEASSEDGEEEIDPEDPDYKVKRHAQRERQRKRAMERQLELETYKLKQQKKAREEGEPTQYTTRAPSEGWYRMCVTPSDHQIVVEMEMRKESELGAIDEAGHVVTYEQRKMKQEDEELDKDTASQEGIKEEDFEETRSRMKDLRRLLNEIQAMQQKERRRVSVHAETNEHSHSRMVMNSLMETIFFMAITGFQVYTIRKWFSGAPALGR